MMMRLHWIIFLLLHTIDCISEETWLSGLSVDFAESQYNEAALAPRRQKLQICNSTSWTDEKCLPHWDAAGKSYKIHIYDHYKNLVLDSDHSVLMSLNKDHITSQQIDRPVLLLVDARCYASWPFNPYHKMVDCLVHIIPALTNFLMLVNASNLIDRQWKRHYFVDPKTKSTKFVDKKLDVVILVDESTDRYCAGLKCES